MSKPTPLLMQDKVELARSHRQLADALAKINNTIYARGAPLGSDCYFEIRGICCDELKRIGRIE